jgi:hypothetical protein
MKIVMAAAIVALSFALPIGPADGARLDASNLEADCADDGVVKIDGTARYVGGQANLTAFCRIELGYGEKLVLRNVEVSSTSALVVHNASEGGGSAYSIIKIVDSVFDIAGAFELSAGCNAGDLSVPDHDASIIIKRSKLRGEVVHACSSLDWDGGRVRVTSSDITATTTTFPFEGIRLVSSPLFGANGTTIVKDSTLTAPTGINISASDVSSGGRTVAVRNVFVGSGTVITAGAAGSCRSNMNSPAVACTP